MRRNRMLIVIAILLMSIGFAAVATNLFINGNILIGTNEEDFDVYFSKAIVDGVDESSKVISSDGKSITFVTKNLKSVGETSILDYVVTNNSTQYDADVEVTCTPNETEYFSITNQIKGVVKAQSEENGKTTVTLNKKTLEEQKITFTCTITAQAIEREITMGKDETNTYSLGGYLVDSNNEIQPNQSLVVYSNTPHYVTTDLTGYFYVEGLEKGSHEVFYMGNMLIEELKNKTKAEIETSALKKLNITTSSTSAKFDDQLLIKDFVVNKTNDIKVVSLNVDDETYNKIVTDEEEVSFKVDKTNESKWTNIAASNGATPSYSNGAVTVSNITDNTIVLLSEKLNKVTDNIDNSKTTIVMLKSENISNMILLNKNSDVILNLNDKNIVSTDPKYSLSTSGKLIINSGSKELGTIENDGYGAVICESCEKLTINGGTYTSNTTTIYNAAGVVELNNATFYGGYSNGTQGGYSEINNSKIVGMFKVQGDTAIISGGEYNTFHVMNKGTLKINDKKGKVYISNDEVLDTIRVEDATKLYINGNRASKTVGGVTEYDDQVCTDDPNDFDKGICIYSSKAIITSYASNVEISGMTAISPLATFWQVRTGNATINNVYSKLTGNACIETNNAYCYNFLNHYDDSNITIKNTIAINNHSAIIRSWPPNSNVTIVENSDFYEYGAATALFFQTGSNVSIKDTNVESLIASPIGYVGNGKLEITGGKITAGDKPALYASSGIIKINSGELYSKEDNSLLFEKESKVNIYGGKFEYGGNINIRGGLKVFNNNQNVYINGGEFVANNGGSAIIIQENNGAVYMCDGILKGIKDYWNVVGSTGQYGTFYYSNKVKFTSGTNVPTYNSGAPLSPNYTGTCLVK